VKDQPKNLAWHYTTGHIFLKIVDSGPLLPIPTNGAPPSERPVIWFSMERYWEPTASKACREPNGTIRTFSMTETYEKCGGLTRIGVDPDLVRLHDFGEFVQMSGIPSLHADWLRREGRRQGANPKKWRVSFDPIPRDLWAAVDVWDGRKWVRVMEASARRGRQQDSVPRARYPP
jgi:hypothetical protein